MIAVGHQLPGSMKQFTDAADAENLNRNTFIKNNVKYIFLSIYLNVKYLGLTQTSMYLMVKW